MAKNKIHFLQITATLKIFYISYVFKHSNYYVYILCTDFHIFINTLYCRVLNTYSNS